MALLDESGSSTDALCHAQGGSTHDDCDAASAECGDGEGVFDGGESCGGGEEADVVEFVEEGGLGACAEGVGGRQEREAVGVLAESAAELVVSGER